MMKQIDERERQEKKRGVNESAPKNELEGVARK